MQASFLSKRDARRHRAPGAQPRPRSHGPSCLSRRCRIARGEVISYPFTDIGLESEKLRTENGSLFEELPVQEPDGFFDVLLLDDEGDVSTRSALRDHQDVDPLDGAEDARGDPGLELEVLPDETDERP